MRFFPLNVQLHQASSFKSPVLPNSACVASCSSGPGIRPWHGGKEEPSSGASQIYIASGWHKHACLGSFCKLAVRGPASSVSGQSDGPPLLYSPEGMKRKGFPGEGRIPRKEGQHKPCGRADGGNGEAESLCGDGGRQEPRHLSTFLTHPRSMSSHSAHRTSTPFSASY